MVASERTSSVLAMPGTPSSRAWPSDTSAISIRSIASVAPSTTLPSSARAARNRLATSSMQDVLLELVHGAPDPVELACGERSRVIARVQLPEQGVEASRKAGEPGAHERLHALGARVAQAVVA